jgi:ribonuclease HII
MDSSELPQNCTPIEGEQFFRKLFNPLVLVSLDEAGRGPLAGPVVAAAVILGDSYDLPGLNDSKKISEKSRELLFPLIQSQALAYGIGLADAQEIDEINILNATFLAMRRALSDCLHLAGYARDFGYHILVDGNHKIRAWNPNIQTPVIKGDARVASIAAASVLAKVTRDRIMLDLDLQYPAYGFAKHKGYPSADHVEVLKNLGYSAVHRKTFRVKALDQYSLF